MAEKEDGKKPDKDIHDRKTGRKIVCLSVAVLLLTGAFFGGFFTYKATLDDEIKSLLWLKEKIQNEYYEEISDEKFYDAVFAGVNGILDDYSYYETAEQYAESRRSATGTWNGVGLVFSTADGAGEKRLLIVRVCGNSPAESAGIKEGTYLLGFCANGEETIRTQDYTAFQEFLSKRAMNEEFSVILRDGPDGTEYEKTLKKQSFTETYVFYRSQTTSYIYPSDAYSGIERNAPIAELPADTAYIRLTQFNGHAGQEFQRAMLTFRLEEKKNLILDLRSNGGGYMDILCNIASCLCKDAQTEKPVIASAEYRSGKKEYFCANGNDYYSYFPSDGKVYVLADSSTASASECLIGCMVDYGTTTFENIFLSTRNGVVRTYGKGIMQTTYARTVFSDSDAVKMTTAKIFWPKGKCIHGVGLTPADGCKTVAENYAQDAEIKSVIEEIKK